MTARLQLDLDSQLAMILDSFRADDEMQTEFGEFRLREDEHGRVIGDFYHCRLTSVFQPIVAAADHQVIGYSARLRCQGRGDAAISPWGIFSMAANDAALVRLDRLCRALHVLNYFRQARAGCTQFVRVESRLISSVKTHHGEVFGELLRHCGISTAQLVIEIPARAVEDSEALARAVFNYRERGYRVAMDHPAGADASIYDALRPEMIKLDVQRQADGYAEVVSRAHAWGGAVTATHVAEERNLSAATGVDSLQGFHIGKPVADIPHKRHRWRLSPTSAESCATG